MLAITFNVSDLTGLSPLSEDVWITGHGIPGTGAATNLMALTPGGVFSQVATTITTASSSGTTATITTAAPHGLITNDKVFVAGVTASYRISSATWASNVATFTTTASHGLQANDPVTISGMTPAGYNGTYQVLAIGSTPSTLKQFTVTNTKTLATATAYGTVNATAQPIPDYSGLFRVTVSSPTTFSYTTTATTTASLKSGTGGTTYSSNVIQQSKIVSCISISPPTNGTEGIAEFTTTVPHGLSVGQTIQISGVKDAANKPITAYNGVFSVSQVSSNTTFQIGYTAAAAPLPGTGGILHKVGLPAVKVSSLPKKSITLDASMTDYSAKFIVYVSALGSDPTALPFSGNGVGPTDPQTPPYANTPSGTPPVTSVFDIVEFAYLPWGATSSGSTATITTTSPHGLTVNSTVTISGVSDASGSLISGYNGLFTVLKVISLNQFTFTTTANLPKGGSGNAGGVTISSGFSTFDVSAVDGLAIPMTLTASSLRSGSVIKSVGVRKQPAFTRAAIGDAFTSFMKKDALGINGKFDRLLYDSKQSLPPVSITVATWTNNAATFTTTTSHGLQANEWVTFSGMTPAGYNGTYQVLGGTGLTATQFEVTNTNNPTTPATANGTVAPIVFQAPEKIDNQFFTIAAPKDWLASQMETASLTDPMVTFWDATINKFFKAGNNLSIYLGKDLNHPIYSGSSNGTSYTLTNGSGDPAVVITKPANVTTASSNWQYVWSQPKAPAGDAGLLQDQIWQALCRGVALDGVTKSPLPPVTISAATRALNAATFTTSAPHGLKANEWVTISGMTPAGYNGTYQVLAIGSTPSTLNQFTVTNTKTLATATVYGTVTPVFSTTAWTDPSKWYTQHKSTAFPGFDSIYCPYSKFLHQSDINGNVGTASTTIFLVGAAYGFGEDENPIVPPTVPPTVPALVPSKLDGTIPDDTTVTLRIAPWDSSVPGAPTSVAAVSGNAQLAVTWVAPASTGGSNITEYIVKYSSNKGAPGSWKRYMPSSPITTTACTVTGLTNGTSYVIKVIAKNAVGISLPSANSAPATPTSSSSTSLAATVSSVLRSVGVVSTNAHMLVTWNRIEAELYTSVNSAVLKQPSGDSQDPSNLGLSLLKRKTNLSYDNVDFGSTSPTAIDFRLASAVNEVGGRIVVRQGNESGPIVASGVVPQTGAWQAFQTVRIPVSASMIGRQNINVSFVSPDDRPFVNLNWFQFAAAGAAPTVTATPTPTPTPTVTPPDLPASGLVVKFVNITGQADSNVFLTADSGGVGNARYTGTVGNRFQPGLGNGVRLTDLIGPGTNPAAHTYTFVIDGYAGGRIYYSIGRAFSAHWPAAHDESISFDMVELNFNGSGKADFFGDLSAMEQIGIPSNLQILDRNGNVIQTGDGPADRKIACAAEVYNELVANAPAGWNSSQVKMLKADGDLLRLVGPNAAVSHYPSLREYVESLHGQTLRIRGRFGGTGSLAGAYYDYSSYVDAEGNLHLRGTLTDPNDPTQPNPNYPHAKTMFVAARDLWNNATPGYSGYGIYLQNGPFTLDGAVTGDGRSTPYRLAPGTGTTQAIQNDLYGWIYGDLVTAYAYGYWGGKYGNDSAHFDGKAPFGAARTSPSTYAAWNVWEQAIWNTSDSYGMALGERFGSGGKRSPLIGVGSGAAIMQITMMGSAPLCARAE